jgi:lysozyme
MNTPQGKGPAAEADDPKNSRVPMGLAPVALVVALIASLQVWEGRELVPYWDKIGGVWTVCAGITGPDVVPGHQYTSEDCDRLEAAYVRKMLGHMGSCAPGDYPFEVVKAFGHFAYNVGTPAFCRSTAARKLRAGDLKGACAEISKWTFAGGKNCRLPGSGCSGIARRRDWERATCEAGL